MAITIADVPAENHSLKHVSTGMRVPLFMRHVEEDRGKQLPVDFVALCADDLKNLTGKDGLFDIAKAGGEDPILTAIHRVDFR